MHRKLLIKIFSMHWPTQQTSSKGSWSICKILITAYKLCLHRFKNQKYILLSQERYLAMKNTFCIAKVLNHVLTKHLLSKYCYAERERLFETKCTLPSFWCPIACIKHSTLRNYSYVQYVKCWFMPIFLFLKKKHPLFLVVHWSSNKGQIPGCSGQHAEDTKFSWD